MNSIMLYRMSLGRLVSSLVVFGVCDSMIVFRSGSIVKKYDWKLCKSFIQNYPVYELPKTVMNVHLEKTIICTYERKNFIIDAIDNQIFVNR